MKICTDFEVKDGDIVLVLYENHVLLRYYYENSNKDVITLKADSNLLGKETFNRSKGSNSNGRWNCSHGKP